MDHLPLSPDLPQCLDAREATRMADYLRRLDAAGLARLAGALQAECTARGIFAAIKPAGELAAEIEDFAREGQR